MAPTSAQIVFHRLFAAAEKGELAILHEHRDEILGFADTVADTWLDKVVTAVVNELPKGGIKDIEWGPIKSAVLASEPQIDQATNDQIAKFFDAVVNGLQNAEKRPSV